MRKKTKMIMKKQDVLILIVIIATLLSLPITFTTKGELFVANLHVAAMVLSTVVIFIGYRAKGLFGETIGKGLNYIFLGVVALAGIHFSELATEIFKIISLSDEGIDILEHALFYIAMILIMYGFYKIGKFLENTRLVK